MRADLEREAAEVQRSFERTPRALMLYRRVHAAMEQTLDPAKRQALDNLAFDVGLLCDRRVDASDADAAEVEARLATITRKVTCAACEAGAPVFGAGEELPLFHQEESNGEIRWFDCAISVASRAWKRRGAR